MVFLKSYKIMSGGRLPETENKRICQISGLNKSGRNCLIKKSGKWLLRAEFLKQYLSEKENG